MPTYKGVSVWLEDSQRRKLNHHEMSIDLVDDRTVTVKTEMSRDEHYTVHCSSPLSVFCDVFVITSFQGVRARAARFHLDKTLAISKDASGSSVDHAEGRFRDHGLKTPNRSFQRGKLGSVEVEIRRIGEIIKGEPREEYGTDRSEGGATEFFVIDDFGQPPWLIFRLDIEVKKSSRAPASTAEHGKRHVPQKMLGNRSQNTSENQPRSTNTGGSSNETSHGRGYLRNSKKRPGEDPIHTNSDQLQKEFRNEEAEEQRLLQILQERLQAKKTKNMELRRLLGEAT